MNRRARRLPLCSQIARLLALFALLLQCLLPVLAQTTPLPAALLEMSPMSPMSPNPPHCPHHAAAKPAATQKVPASPGQGLCCGTSHCLCAVAVAAVNDFRGVPLPGTNHPSPPEQPAATTPAFVGERLRPPDPLRNA